MRFRTRVVRCLRRGPLRRPTDWALLHVAPGAKERRRHHGIDLETARFIEAHLQDAQSAIDVGAHTGAILKDIVRFSPSGDHHAVEPLPNLAAALRSNYPKVTVHECVLGSAAFVAGTGGRSTINHNIDDPGYSSVRRRDHPRLKDARTEPVSVEVRSLDCIAREVESLALVKIDVEGFEVEVLRGAEQMLREQRPVVVFEHERVDVDAESGDTAALHELFTNAGYTISRLVDWQSPVSLDLDAFEASNRNGDSYYVALPVGAE